MKLPIVGWTVDERFLMHRLRSTSIAGSAAVLLAGGFFFNGLSKGAVRWDHFAIIATAAVVKIAVLIYYRLTD